MTVEVGDELQIWRGECTLCPMVTMIRADQPKPTECASCLAPLTNVTSAVARIKEIRE